MRDTLAPPEPHALRPFTSRYGNGLWQLLSPPTLSLFYQQANWCHNATTTRCRRARICPNGWRERVTAATLMRDLFASHVLFEDDASADLPRFERLFRETFEPLSHRIDAWVTLAGHRPARRHARAAARRYPHRRLRLADRRRAGATRTRPARVTW